ncbi:MAG TPA: hypothetical protein VND19_13680 [Acetobacteraceae bacterium]|nr:hypothetical protein [Acetobacteraceae bacterium]
MHQPARRQSGAHFALPPVQCAAIFESQDFIEARGAFMEKRRPVFREA